jgi:hypothetical protein
MVIKSLSLDPPKSLDPEPDLLISTSHQAKTRHTGLAITLNQGMSLSAPPTNGTWIPKVSAVEGGLFYKIIN